VPQNLRHTHESRRPVLPRDAASSAVLPLDVVCLSVCPSFRPSVALMYRFIVGVGLCVGLVRISKVITRSLKLYEIPQRQSSPRDCRVWNRGLRGWMLFLAETLQYV